MSVLNWYDIATPEDKVRGRMWYPAMNRICGDLAMEYETDTETVAAVLAVTSADARLETNIAWTRQVLAGERTYGRYGGQTPSIVGIMAGEGNPGEYVRGPKTSAFFRAIMGDEDAIVLDRWAIFACGFGRDRKLSTGLRSHCEVLYRIAAEETGECPRDMQAIVWTVVREYTLRSDGRSLGLSNIV